MKIAIISVSDKGKDLASTLKEKLDDDSTIIRTDLYHKNVRKNFPFLFYEYDAIIAIMASGILIRSIASLIESKVTDPAILNIDDNGNFVKVIFLKDIHHSVRINPKPQFQVNINQPEEYRTKEEFIDLFLKKYKESNDRIIAKVNKKNSQLDKLFNDIRKIHIKKQ